MTASLIVVASYPKSGNTWVRLLFESLRRGGQGFPLAALPSGFYGYPRRLLFDRLSPVNAADLTDSEIDTMLPAVFRELAAQVREPLVIKAHDRAMLPSGAWLYPPDCVRCAIVLVRHPFDVAVSYAHHLGMSIEAIVALMGENAQPVSGRERRLPPPLHQHIGSWSANAASWIDAKPYRLLMVRYEDLHADPARWFAQMARAAALPATAAQIAGSVEAVNFARLQREEKRHGFNDRPAGATDYFFRSGKPRGWTGMLSEAMQRQIVADHGAMMERLGYGADGAVGALPAEFSP